MRCSCRVCGAYMAQSERGLESGCRCPECFNICRDCMGTAEGPLSLEALRDRPFPEEDREKKDRDI